MTTLTHLKQPFELGGITLQNRSVMAPMTRSRAIGNVPNEMMAEYYGQRATEAGLIITEGTAPSPNGVGYPRIPGVYSAEQTAAWKPVAEAVHRGGAKIFMQLMHTGRIGHPHNLPTGGEILAPSAIQAAGQMYTDQEGPKEHPTPRAMTAEDIETALEEFVTAGRNAIEAGFDGIELHGANGYLIDQFLNPGSNQRDDAWGGSPEARNRFAVEAARRTAAAIGADRVGIRVSPFGAFNDLAPFDGTDEQYSALAAELKQLGIAYIHIVDHSAQGAPTVPDATKAAIRDAFGGPIILSGGYDASRAETDLAEGKGELVAFGRPFLANPDLLTRFEQDAELNQPNYDQLYTPGPEGYTDYPTVA